MGMGEGRRGFGLERLGFGLGRVTEMHEAEEQKQEVQTPEIEAKPATHGRGFIQYYYYYM